MTTGTSADTGVRDYAPHSRHRGGRGYAAARAGAPPVLRRQPARLFGHSCRGASPGEEEIQQQLLNMEHVKELIQDIRRNGGLLDPIIVREGTLEVLEGNSRLAAYRALAKDDPVKWAFIKCTVLPPDIEESLVFGLLGQYHIKGRKDWAPFEQAGFLYRQFRKSQARRANASG